MGKGHCLHLHTPDVAISTYSDLLSVYNMRQDSYNN